MALTAGFDIKLDRVDSDGLPRNRSLWCYTITLPPNSRHRSICLDFRGRHTFTNPANFDAKTATDSAQLEWGDVSYEKTDPNAPVSPTNVTTVVCLKAKNNANPHVIPADGGTVQFCFVGPADGQAGSVSLRTNSRVREQDSNQREWVDLDHGQKDGMEAPLAAALTPEAEDEALAAVTVFPRPVATPGQLITMRYGELVIPNGVAVGITDALDLAEVVDESLAEQPLEAILASDLTRITGLTDRQAARLREALDTATIYELLASPILGRLLRLALTVGVEERERESR